MKDFRISDEAVRQLRLLRDASVEAKPEHAVRVFMTMGFCGGPQWGFSLDMYHEASDECCDFDGMKIIIERDLLEAMGGIDVSLLAEDEEGDSFLVSPLDPDVKAFFEQERQSCGGCGGGHCCGCHGGCHDDEEYVDDWDDAPEGRSCGCGDCGSNGDCGSCGDCSSNGDCGSCGNCSSNGDCGSCGNCGSCGR